MTKMQILHELAHMTNNGRRHTINKNDLYLGVFDVYDMLLLTCVHFRITQPEEYYRW